jgi:hypothetical protein
MLNRFVERVNSAQTRSGELRRVLDRDRNGVAYHVREFGGGKRPDEAYTVLADGMFAWSNSEELIRAVIDRAAGAGEGLSAVEAFREVRARLPVQAVASLFVDPRYLELALRTAPRPAKEGDRRVLEAASSYLGAVRYLGVSAEWRNGLFLHEEDLVDPSRLPASLARWGQASAPPDPALLRVPASALVVASASADVPSLFDALLALKLGDDRERQDTVRQALNGLLQGLDVHDDVLPRLGPGAVAYIERPARPREGVSILPAVVSFQVGPSPESGRAAGAVENALRTMLALHALGPKGTAAKLHFDPRTADGVRIVCLGPTTPFAFALHHGRLTVGTSAGAVERAIRAADDPQAGERLARARAAWFPKAESFFVADLGGIYRFADPIRPQIARRVAARQKRPEDDAARDLDEALALIHLFDVAFFTSQIEPGFTSVRRRLGLVRTRKAVP